MKLLKTLARTTVLLAGLGLICWGVGRISLAAGLIFSGLVLIIIARALTMKVKS